MVHFFLFGCRTQLDEEDGYLIAFWAISDNGLWIGLSEGHITQGH